jgi:hypothetical protein
MTAPGCSRVRDSASEVFRHLLNAVLPNGEGHIVVFNAYFDEAGTHRGSRCTTVAGYVFEADQSVRFTSAWNEVLAAEGLTEYGTADCVRGGKAFCRHSEARRAAIREELATLIRKYVAYGVAFTVRDAEFQALVPRTWVDHYGHPYTVCLHACVAAVADWADSFNYCGYIGYFFESGAVHESEACARFRDVVKDDRERLHLRYAAHAFVNKRLHPPCDAADYLAWHTWKQETREIEAADTSLLPSGEFLALLDEHYEAGRYKISTYGEPELKLLFADHPTPAALRWHKRRAGRATG